MRKDKTLERIIKKIAVDNSLSESTVEDVVAHMFSQTRKSLAEPDMPSVLLHNFGRFQVSLGRINGIIRRAFLNYRQGKISKDRLREIITKLWPVRSRLQIEN